MKPKILTASFVRSLIPPRTKDSHKGDYGRVLVVAGARGMSGAAMLAAHGALRAGAGLVTLAVPSSIQPVVAAGVRHEAMTLSLKEGRSGSAGRGAVPQIHEFMQQARVTSLVLGPGLGMNDDTRALVTGVLDAAEVPVVLDADGISVLAGKPEVLNRTKAPVVITPHPGELGRLSGIPVAEIQARRAETAFMTARDCGVVCLLKGHRTVIADGTEIFINPTGNPGMATGGMGDVLSGMIAALVAQVRGRSLLYAACAGAFLHGLAGDIAAKEKTELCLLAGDVAEALPQAVGKVQKC